MIELKDLLLRFDNLLLSEGVKVESIKKSLLKNIGLDINPSDIKIKNNIIYLNIKPIYKNEILLKKEKIFNDLNESLGKKTPIDIR